MEKTNSNDKESEIEDALEQDVIYAPDIESGKDITDITDIEKEEKKNEKEDKCTKKQKNFTKKTFRAEENDFNFNGSIDGKLEDNQEGSEKRVVVEKSPKERFARFDDELGVGAFKRVFRGYDYDTGREIAWNVINVHFMSEDSIQKIKEEINIIKKLNHPNIINFVSGFYNEDKNEIVIITEIFNSGSLKQHLNKIKHPRLKVIKFWCKEILKGLKYLHESQDPIIHRDIKCDNIFINPNSGLIKIGDLGYSCILRNEHYAKSLSGTPEFMAPEVINGKYGVLADIYSFGICVLEIVTREKPYKECENNLIEIFEKIKNNILPKNLEKINNPRMLNFIKSCLKTEEERPSADDLLNSEFLNDLDHEENNYPALMYPDNTSGQVPCSRQNSNVLTSFMSSNLNSIATTINTLQSSEILNSQNRYENRYGDDKSNLINYTKRKESSPINRRFINKLNIQTNDKEEATSPITLNNNPKPKDIVFMPLKSVNESYTPLQAPVRLGHLNEYNIHEDNPKNNCKKSIEGKSKSTSQINLDFPDNQDDLNNLKFFNENEIAKINHNSNFILNKVKNIPRHHASTHKLSPFNPASYILKNGGGVKNIPHNSSKIEMRIEEQNKEDNSIMISCLKKEKSKPKGQKISFRFNLNSDTCEGILNELTDEIGLNEEEKSSIMVKLSNLIKNYTTTSSKNKPMKTTNDTNENDQFIDTKRCFEKFFSKFSKIIEKSEELIQTSKIIKDEINSNKNSVNDEDRNELNHKVRVLEELIKIGSSQLK